MFRIVKLLGPIGLLIIIGLACSDGGKDVVGPSGPTLSVADASVTEGRVATFTVTLSSTSSSDVTFSFMTANGTATAGADYIGVTGADTIAANATSTTITVTTVDNAAVDGNKTYTFTISGASGASILRATATGTIVDDETGGGGVSYANDVRPLFLTAAGGFGCTATNCHGGGAVGGGFLMGTTAPYATLINAVGTNGAVIVPGNASLSNLYLKTTAIPPFGGRMPLGGPFLSVDQQNLIRDWINQGAQDN